MTLAMSSIPQCPQHSNAVGNIRSARIFCMKNLHRGILRFMMGGSWSFSVTTACSPVRITQLIYSSANLAVCQVAPKPKQILEILLVECP